ncbi:MAG: WYL domain-containing protein [Lapillicoccus sp.]
MSDTTGRALRLLSLLQARPVWTGPALAERLGVTTRSIRRDVERLREFGYPVRATKGVGGGYQLGAGLALPPLLLDDEEAVAIAVCLRLAAGGTIEGLGEAAVRTLAKLDQVLPARLRSKVAAVHGATVTLDSTAERVDSETLLTLARACRETERLTFAYAAATGAATERRTEPYRLIATGRRWYLMAFDLDRDDWRSFRLDRISAAAATGWRFTPREAPDAATFVQRSVSQSPYRFVARVRVQAGAAEVAAVVPPTAGQTERLDDRTTLLTTGGNRLDWMALHIASLPWPVEVLDPPELAAAMRELAERLTFSCRPMADRANPTATADLGATR